ncbi:MAG TPA: hypothetical protein VFS80_00725 [Burkholderiales bacterium]|nr:hypothetical protein [Burkholderiales bacterium]
MVQEFQHLDAEIAAEAAAVAEGRRAEARVRRLLVQRHGELDQPLDGAGKEVAVGRDAVHAPGARRALQEFGHRLRLHGELRGKLVHARRLRAAAFEQRRGSFPQRLVLRRQHRAMLRQAQARAFARKASRVDEKIDHDDERRADLRGARADRLRLRSVPIPDSLFQPFASGVPFFAPHGVAHAAHVERHQIGRIGTQRMEHLLEPLRIHHPVGEERSEGLLRPEPGDALPAPARRRQRIHYRARADQPLRAGVAQQQPVPVPCAHAVRKSEPGEASMR